MAVTETFESLLRSQHVKLCELEMATAFIRDKKNLSSVLFEASEHIEALNANVLDARHDLAKLKEEVDNCKILIELSQSLNEKLKYMEENVPVNLIQVGTQRGIEEPRCSNEPTVDSRNHESSSSKLSREDLRELSREDLREFSRGDLSDLIDPSECALPLKDCRKTLFREVEDTYCIKPITETEFSKIPKYMLGRHTLNNLNDFISTLNKVLKAKYTLLALGKVGARKKGELDLFLQFKKEEIDVCEGKQRKYFFTAEDYHRETKMKLDKTKLNFLTILRHCKRLLELRLGKNVKYEIIQHR